MIIEITTGNDSLRSTSVEGRRNCSVRAFTHIHGGTSLDPIMPLFVAYKLKLKYFETSSVVRALPPTTLFAESSAGRWLTTRNEVKQGTEILMEVTRRDAHGAFSESTAYMLLIASDSAPLIHLTVALPPHPLSAVPSVPWEGRFIVVDDDKLLPPDSLAIWRDAHFGLSDSDGGQLSDIFDIMQPVDERVISIQELERAPVKHTKIREGATLRGKTRVIISRPRRVKTRPSRLPGKS